MWGAQGGFKRHFAVADDIDGVSSTPVVAFLKHQFAGGAPMVGSDTDKHV